MVAFIGVDVGGTLSLWNVCKSSEEPLARVVVASPVRLVDGACLDLAP